MLPDNPVFHHIERRITRRFRRGLVFGLHVVVFLFTMLFFGIIPLLWLALANIEYDFGQNFQKEALWIAGTWLCLVIAHGFYLIAANARDRNVEAELRRYYEKVSRIEHEKSKRHHLEVSDDGELITFNPDEADQHYRTASE